MLRRHHNIPFSQGSLLNQKLCKEISKEARFLIGREMDAAHRNLKVPFMGSEQIVVTVEELRFAFSSSFPASWDSQNAHVSSRDDKYAAPHSFKVFQMPR